MSIYHYVRATEYEVSKEGGPVIRPLLSDFPLNKDILIDMDHVAMLGEALMFVLVIEPKPKEVSSYFPNDDWYGFHL